MHEVLSFDFIIIIIVIKIIIWILLHILTCVKL